MKIRHFYHVFAAGGWAGPVAEHAEALGRAGLHCPVTITLVGPEEDRFRARERITERFWEWYLPEPEAWIEADAGFEQVTLRQIHLWAHQTPGDYAVLYAHTKGAYSNSPFNEHWRRSMTRYTVAGWRDCVAKLESGWDTAGCHWLTPERDHDPPRFPVTTPMYGGNFWWGHSNYLRQLPPPGDEYRHQAEEWVGLAGPKAYDFLPGWPSMKLCAPDVYAAELAAAEAEEQHA